MDRFNLLSVALGLACLAGIDLYLTVFATGLAIHFHWITLAPNYQSLEVLGQPWIIAIAGILYVLEFFADKVPWLDSAWDTVHTIIRPIGGALLAIQVLGHHSAVVDVLIILLGGSASLVTHTAKASTRLVANSSPEPASNIGLSVGEDLAVFGGLALIHYNPVLALSIFALAIAAFLYFAPKVFRSMKAKIWLALNKLNAAPDVRRPATLPIALPSCLAPIFSKQNLLGETIAWAVPCVSGRGRRIPANLFGALVATNEEPHKLVFVGRKNWKPFSQTIELEGSTIAREPQFLSENLAIVPTDGRGPKYSFLFTRARGTLVELIAEDLRGKMNRSAALAHSFAQEPIGRI
ncbi:MAG: hypothetical protein DME97_10145 [Verrucomicrobia bacterium]|nr:MAG: hypothetical protein DME97_10145 [Verrucomicrobiota bacterium]